MKNKKGDNDEIIKRKKEKKTGKIKDKVNNIMREPLRQAGKSRY